MRTSPASLLRFLAGIQVPHLKYAWIPHPRYLGCIGKHKGVYVINWKGVCSVRVTCYTDTLFDRFTHHNALYFLYSALVIFLDWLQFTEDLGRAFSGGVFFGWAL